jgi:alginate O-acetyltransferase complex protein AlgI
MSFSSPLFLFVFFPVVILLYLLVGKRWRNIVLIAGSLLFYLWGEPLYFPILMVSILVNYGISTWMEGCRQIEKSTKGILWIGITWNLGLLVFFKIIVIYWQPILKSLEALTGVSFPAALGSYLTKALHFPLGMSFFSFAILSYLIDLYFKRIHFERSIFRLASYVLMFPKLIAGPIARYRELAPQVDDRDISSANLAAGMQRFVIGLAKKVLIADLVGKVVDMGVLSQPVADLPTWVAWLVLMCYSLQIYFDFSGYTDMAIGLAQMMGFKLPENFNYPYAATSISDFWRRWHMTLSGWFRDYLFYPLERRRDGRGGIWQTVNVLLVFLATGLWHGLTLNFIVWGLWHGAAIALERSRFGSWLAKAWKPLRHLYTIIVVLVGWVFFRTNSLPYAFGYMKALFGGGNRGGFIPYSALPPLQTSDWLAILFGMLLLVPLFPWLRRKINAIVQIEAGLPGLRWVKAVCLVGLLILSLAVLAASTYQPYIYGTF